MQDISEPVATLINLFKEHPRRFKIIEEDKKKDGYYVHILDRDTLCMFSARRGLCLSLIPCENTAWMTGAEFKHCEWHIRNHLYHRKQRVQKLLDERRIKRESAKREALRGYYMNIYC